MPPPPTPPPDRPVSPPIHGQAPLPPPNKPLPIPKWPVPKFNFRVEDISHPGAELFFSNVHPTKALTAAVIASFVWLYTPDSVPTQFVRSIFISYGQLDHITGQR